MIPWWAALIIVLLAILFTAWCVRGLTEAQALQTRLNNLEMTASRIDRWQSDRIANADQRVEFYKSMLNDYYHTMTGQTRGLQRQARKINRLRAEIEKLSTQGTGR